MVMIAVPVSWIAFDDAQLTRMVTALVVTMAITRPRLARTSPGLFVLHHNFSARNPPLAAPRPRRARAAFGSRGGRRRADDDR